MTKLPKAIFFDLDGVLVDATELHYNALNDALGIFGVGIGRDDHLKVYNGLPTKEKLRMMSEKGMIPMSLHNSIIEQKKILTRRMVSVNCRPSYDKIMMLSWLRRMGVAMACCSNAIKESVDEMLSLSGIIDFFLFTLGNDSGFVKPKPSPSIYNIAFDKLKSYGYEIGSKGDVWIVEDAPHGVEAARAFGAGKVIEVSGYNDVNLNLFL